MSLTECEATSVACVSAGPMTVDDLPVRRPSLIDIIPPDSQFFDHVDWAWRRSYVKLVVDNNIFCTALKKSPNCLRCTLLLTGVKQIRMLTLIHLSQITSRNLLDFVCAGHTVRWNYSLMYRKLIHQQSYTATLFTPVHGLQLVRQPVIVRYMPVCFLWT
jgi:hypothetical protein